MSRYSVANTLAVSPNCVAMLVMLPSCCTAFDCLPRQREGNGDSLELRKRGGEGSAGVYTVRQHVGTLRAPAECYKGGSP